MSKNWNLEDLKHKHIVECLEAHSWNKTQTASALGVCIKTLRNILKRMNSSKARIRIQFKEGYPQDVPKEILEQFGYMIDNGSSFDQVVSDMNLDEHTALYMYKFLFLDKRKVSEIV